MKSLIRSSFFIALALLNSTCVDEDLMGHLRLAFTDSPMDGDNVKSVNIVFTNLEAMRKGNWKSLRSFDQPVGINFLNYTGGKSFPMVDDYVEPGDISELRLQLNVASQNSSLVLNPVCNIQYTDGTTKELFLEDGQPPEIILQGAFGSNPREISDFTFDFDIRKSIYESNGMIFLKPVIRVVKTALTGNIEASTINNTVQNDRLVVYAYKAGSYSPSEAATPPAGEVPFKNAITSIKVVKNKFIVGFLEEGNYDLIFVRVTETGSFKTVVGKYMAVAVKPTEVTQLEIDMQNLASP